MSRATQPALGAIKLAWWRERLEELDEGKVPAEPRLQAAARDLLPHGIKGIELAQLEAGWATLLQEDPQADVALARGRKLFELAARLLDSARTPPDLVGIAGRIYATTDLRRRRLGSFGWGMVADSGRIPPRLRPLTGLAALAKRDLLRGGPPFEAEATPGRAWTLLRHRVLGRL